MVLLISPLISIAYNSCSSLCSFQRIHTLPLHGNPFTQTLSPSGTTPCHVHEVSKESFSFPCLRYFYYKSSSLIRHCSPCVFTVSTSLLFLSMSTVTVEPAQSLSFMSAGPHRPSLHRCLTRRHLTKHWQLQRILCNFPSPLCLLFLAHIGVCLRLFLLPLLLGQPF
jgi:hypothetical protein